MGNQGDNVEGPRRWRGSAGQFAAEAISSTCDVSALDQHTSPAATVILVIVPLDEPVALPLPLLLLRKALPGSMSHRAHRARPLSAAELQRRGGGDRARGGHL